MKTTVNYNGAFYKKVNGKWVYYGTKKEGRPSGWEFKDGYWWYHDFAYTHYGTNWYVYHDNDWHWVGSSLPDHPQNPKKGMDPTYDKPPPAFVPEGYIIAADPEFHVVISEKPTS